MPAKTVAPFTAEMWQAWISYVWYSSLKHVSRIKIPARSALQTAAALERVGSIAADIFSLLGSQPAPRSLPTCVRGVLELESQLRAEASAAHALGCPDVVHQVHAEAFASVCRTLHELVQAAAPDAENGWELRSRGENAIACDLGPLADSTPPKQGVWDKGGDAWQGQRAGALGWVAGMRRTGPATRLQCMGDIQASEVGRLRVIGMEVMMRGVVVKRAFVASLRHARQKA